MHIIISPDSFKGTLTAKEAAQTMKDGLLRVFPHAQYTLIPIADGGEGTLEVLVELTEGQMQQVVVEDPLGRPVDARFGILGDGKTAVIEMAEASGIMRVTKSERNPFRASTYGTGELIRHALDAGCQHFILAIGGSATNDGGIGAMRALGARFLDGSGKVLETDLPSYQELATIDLAGLDSRLPKCRFDIACDVDNPLLGERGATAIFGPQKGVERGHHDVLENVLRRYAQVVEKTTGKSVHELPGAGAAGGLGTAFLAFLPSTLRPGIEIILDEIDFDSKLDGASWVVTGEGKSDVQTLSGKAPLGIAFRAKKAGVPVALLSGMVREEDRVLLAPHFDLIESIVSPSCHLEEALSQPVPALLAAAERLGKSF